MHGDKKKMSGLMMVFGKPKKGDEDSEDEKESDSEAYDTEFAAAVKEALPDLTDDQVASLKQAIESCIDKRMGDM